MSTKESTELAPINKQTSRTKLGHQWDLTVAIVVNARSLSQEKLDELQVTVNDHDASIVCMSGTGQLYFLCAIFINTLQLLMCAGAYDCALKK